MINKSLRLGKALIKESGKRLPYVLLLLVAIGLVQGYRSYNKIKQTNDDTHRIVQQLDLDNPKSTFSVLSQQIKDLQAQNIELTKENKAYTKCVAKAFLEYINTGNRVVLQDDDLNACVLLEVAKIYKDNPASTSNTSQNSTSQSQTNNQSKTNDNQTNSPPGLVECSSKFLLLTVNCGITPPGLLR